MATRSPLATDANVPNDGTAIDDIVGMPETGQREPRSPGPERCVPGPQSCPNGKREETNACVVQASVRLRGQHGDIPGYGRLRCRHDHRDRAVGCPRSGRGCRSGRRLLSQWAWQVALEEGPNDITVTVTALDEETEKVYTVLVYRRAATSTIEGTVTDADGVGIKDVEITVDGSMSLINGSLNSTRHTTAARRELRVVKTDGDGEYSLEVESTASGNVDVLPWKSGYSFDPASRSVRAVANATTTGIDFTGATNASIRGKVVDGTGDAAVWRDGDGGATRRNQQARPWRPPAPRGPSRSAACHSAGERSASIEGRLQLHSERRIRHRWQHRYRRPRGARHHSAANVKAVRDPTSATDGYLRRHGHCHVGRGRF